ncbi:MAG: hypothetical protein ACPLYF_01030, partial [Fervidobacterium sp.]
MRRIIILLLVTFMMLWLAGCSKDGNSKGTVNNPASGLTSIEASKIAYQKIKGNFEKTILFRAVPVDDKNSTNLLLDKNWYK